MIQVINSHYNNLKAITITITIALGLHKLGFHLQKIHYLFSFEWLSLLNHLASPSHHFIIGTSVLVPVYTHTVQLKMWFCMTSNTTLYTLSWKVQWRHQRAQDLVAIGGARFSFELLEFSSPWISRESPEETLWSQAARILLLLSMKGPISGWYAFFPIVWLNAAPLCHSREQPSLREWIVSFLSHHFCYQTDQTCAVWPLLFWSFSCFRLTHCLHTSEQNWNGFVLVCTTSSRCGTLSPGTVPALWKGPNCFRTVMEPFSPLVYACYRCHC